MIKFIVPTCDKYVNVIEAKKYSFDKYCDTPLDVTVLGYKEPRFNLEEWNFVSLGNDRGPAHFSNDLLSYFNDFEEELFVFANDDIVAVDKLDTELLSELIEVFKDSSVGRICLSAAGPSAYRGATVYKDCDGYQLIEKPQNSEYRLSLHYSIWRTSYFKKHLKPNMTPWDMDMNGAAKNDDVKILATSGRYFLDFGHIFRKGKRITKNWHFSEYTKKSLSQEDKAYLGKIIRSV